MQLHLIINISQLNFESFEIKMYVFLVRYFLLTLQIIHILHACMSPVLLPVLADDTYLSSEVSPPNSSTTHGTLQSPCRQLPSA